MAIWPASLPALMVGVSESRQDGAIRSPMSAGPSKARRRFSAVSRSVSGVVVLNTADRATFDTFFADTLAEGSLTFDMDDPRDGTSQSWRFTAPPQFQARAAESGIVTIWMASLSLEILP